MQADGASAQMEMILRPATAADAEACGAVCYDGFKAIDERHGFPPVFPSVEPATGRVRAMIDHPAVFGVVAERGGRILGFNFLSERDPIRAVGPIVVDPAAEGRGVGRRLMAAALERAAGARGVRLVQEAFNMRSLALYAALGFEAREPLVALAGRPSHAPLPGWEVRPLRAGDLDACAALHEGVHGYSRANELREAVARGFAWVALRDGRVAAYMAAATAWVANHGVAETEGDMEALLAGAGHAVGEPLGLQLPIRQAGLFRWCLAANLRPVKPMLLMSKGEYREPRGAWFPSVLY
jgi:GNAT superfamily N-acetyltransferase